eukprot:1683187-Amphidinium_carterae.1
MSWNTGSGQIAHHSAPWLYLVSIHNAEEIPSLTETFAQESTLLRSAFHVFTCSHSSFRRLYLDKFFSGHGLLFIRTCLGALRASTPSSSVHIAVSTPASQG